MTPTSGTKGAPSGAWVLSPETLLTRLHELSEDLMLSPPQVAIILQVDEDWLRKQRQKQSNPTNPDDETPIPHTKLGEAKNAGVRYRLGDIRAHLAARRVINTHGGRACAFSSFADFMSRARIEDTWLFAIPPAAQHPIDFFEALRSEVLFSDVSWLTLGEYLDSVKVRVVEQKSHDIGIETSSGSTDVRDIRI